MPIEIDMYPFEIRKHCFRGLSEAHVKGQVIVFNSIQLARAFESR